MTHPQITRRADEHGTLHLGNTEIPAEHVRPAMLAAASCAVDGDELRGFLDMLGLLDVDGQAAA